jgi:hypothetical protein
MRIAIEDLEALKELADELEESHVDAERALQEEIGQLLPRRAIWILMQLANRREGPRARGAEAARDGARGRRAGRGRDDRAVPRARALAAEVRPVSRPHAAR